jgi:VIT1/CCC1 family predicted Fe2+/Mn2+ transporter
VQTQSTRAQFTYGFSKYIETGWFTEHLLNGIGFQIAAAFPAVRYYITPENENQAVFRIFSAF